MNHNEFAQLTRSQKVTLAVIKAKQRLKNFTDIGSDTWTRIVPYYVSNVAGVPYAFDPTTKTLTLTSMVDPKTLDITAEYSFFFSDFPINHDVEYQARLIDIGALKLELDTENTGIAIESDSSIKLENTDGFFDEIYDTLIWENQKCEFYSWSPLLEWSERKLIYRGYITTKQYNERFITFAIKDSFFKLREKIPFTGSRLIYGKAKNLDCGSIDKVGAGFALSGTVSALNDRDLLSGVLSATAGSSTITGSGSAFLSQLIVGDKIRIIDGLIEYTYTINAIASNTSLTISGTISTTFAGVTGRNPRFPNNIFTGSGTLFLKELSPGDTITVNETDYTIETITSDTEFTTDEQVQTALTSLSASNLPIVNYRFKNRFWNVAGHLLADYATGITVVYSQRYFSVADASHLSAGDTVKINGNIYSITRVSGNEILINQAAIVAITAGNEVKKFAVQNVYCNDLEFVQLRDVDESNIDAGCELALDELAEFNAAEELVTSASLLFSAGSRTVSSLSSSIDLTTLYQTRDWIKPYSGSVSDWYEILQVFPSLIKIRVNYGEPRDYAGPALYKKPAYLGDDSPVLVDCMGKRTSQDADGYWLKTAADAVKDICELLEMENINEAGFAAAKADGPYCLSIVYPEKLGGQLPIARDMINKINKSVFGSLHANDDFEITYSILNADRDEEFETIKDDDILSFTTSTKNQIVKNVNAKYRKEYGTDINQVYTFSNANISGISSNLDIDLALYEDEDAKTITQRHALIRSNSQTTVAIKGKLNLANKALNSRVYLDLRRLFKRYGSASKLKTGLVSFISKDSTTVELQVNDLGNMFSRIGSIAPNIANDYSAASESEISNYLYIVDNDTETPDAANDNSLGANLIG